MKLITHQKNGGRSLKNLRENKKFVSFLLRENFVARSSARKGHGLMSNVRFHELFPVLIPWKNDKFTEELFSDERQCVAINVPENGKISNEMKTENF